MSNVKAKIQVAVICLLLIAIFTISSNAFGYAQEMQVEGDQPLVLNESGEENVSQYSLDSAGLVGFEIHSDPFSGGLHQGDTRNIVCAAVIDVSEFDSKAIDYIVINWDNDKYRMVSDSCQISITYYLEFFGEHYSREETSQSFSYTDDGVRAIGFEIKSHLWYETWKWTTVTEILCVINFKLEAVDEEQQTEIHANYFHCTEEMYITGVSLSPEGEAGVTWDIDRQIAPIQGVHDYIWD